AVSDQPRLVAHGLQPSGEITTNHLFVFHDENLQAARGLGGCRRLPRGGFGNLVIEQQWQPDRKGRSLADLRINFDVSAVALHDTEGDTQAEAVALVALGGEERFEEALLDRLAHAGAGV